MSARLAPAEGSEPRRPASGALREAPWVAFGGALGAMLRGGVAHFLSDVGWGGLAATQTVNLVGAFTLGFLLTTLERTRPRPRLRAFLAIGMHGAFTTYSTLVAEAGEVAAATSTGVALAFLSGSLVLGLGAFLGGRLFACGLRVDAAHALDESETRS